MLIRIGYGITDLRQIPISNTEKRGETLPYRKCTSTIESLIETGDGYHFNSFVQTERFCQKCFD